jgi:hypothetical protein
MLGHPAVARSGNGQERPDKVIFDRWEAASRNFVPFRIAENDLKTGFKGQMACRSTKVLPCRCLANNCRYALILGFCHVWMALCVQMDLN